MNVNPTSEPRLLILETSGRPGWVALAEGEQLRGVQCLEESRRHARDLAPTVAALLAGQGWGPLDLQGVIVSLGPGSYTGLRVGIMSAKTLAYAIGCSLLGVDTFTAIARQAPPEPARLDVLADAQQERAYLRTFTRTPAGWTPEGPLRIRPVADWLRDREAQTWATGPGLSRWEGRLPPELPRVTPEQRDPQPASLLELGLLRWRAGERDDPFALEPLYLRPSSAEEQWQQRQSAPPG